MHEETGFDVTSMLEKEDYLENKLNDQVSRLYIVQNVPLDTKFQPKTRKEIKVFYLFNPFKYTDTFLGILLQ